MSQNTFQKQITTYKTGLRRSATVNLAAVDSNVYTYDFDEAGGQIQKLTMVVAGCTGTALSGLTFALGVNGVYDLFQGIEITTAGENFSAIVEVYNTLTNTWVMNVRSEDTVDPPTVTSKVFNGFVNSLRMSCAVGQTFSFGSLAVFTEIVV